jgi:MoxR-like ATPase
VRRPLLEAVSPREGPPPVLLIDEVDRADDEFEALLLESLGEGSVTVPELGTFTAKQRPIVVLTSNRSRELHDALRRRCLYHWLEYPEPQRVVAILRRTAPEASVPLVESVSRFVGHVRELDVDKPPGVAEAINWVAALGALGVTELVREVVVPTLGAVAKTPDDRDLVVASLDDYAFG